MTKLLRSIVIGAVLWVAAAGAAFAQCGTSAPANKFCGGGSSPGLATWLTIPTGALTPIPGGTVLGNNTGATAVPSATTAPVLGVPGASQGSLGFAGASGGTATITAQATAGSPTLTLPNTSGTLADGASAPLVLSPTTGNLTCPTCVTSSGGGAITGTPPISVSAAGVVSINAPYTTLTANNGGIVYSGPTNLAILAGTATARQMLQSGATAAPAWSTATYPATTIAGGLLVSGSLNTVTASATPVLGVPGSLQGTLGFAGVSGGTATITAQATAGSPTLTLPNTSGTFAVNASGPLVLSATTGDLTCPTCVTSSGGGAITGSAPIAVSAAGVVSINAPYGSLTAANGGIVYSGAANLAILAPTATASQPLLSGASTTPSWANVSYPTSATSGGIPYFSSATAMTSSGVMGANQIVLGGGAGAAPTSLSCATSSTLLHGGTPPTCTGLAFGDILSATLATTAQYLAGTASELVAANIPYTSEVVLTQSTGTLALDFNTFQIGAVTLSANITSITVTNAKPNQAFQIRFIQPAGSTFTATGYSSTFKFPGGVAPTLTATVNAVDALEGYCVSSSYCVANMVANVK